MYHFMYAQGDHNWTMKNPEIFADMLATEDTLTTFANTLGPNETPCNTASHCDPCCLKFKLYGYIEYF